MGERLQPCDHDGRWCPHRRYRWLARGVTRRWTGRLCLLCGGRGTRYLACQWPSGHAFDRLPSRQCARSARADRLDGSALARRRHTAVSLLDLRGACPWRCHDDGWSRRAGDRGTHTSRRQDPAGIEQGLAHRAPVQADLARSVAAVRGARAYVADEVGRSWDEVVASGRVTDERKVALRLAANAAAERRSARSIAATRPPGERRSTADRRSSESSGTYMLRRNMRWLPLGYTSRSAVSGSASKPIPAGSSFRPSPAARTGRPCHSGCGAGCRGVARPLAPCSR